MTDEQWEIIKTLIPEAKPEGRPQTVDLREIINGIFYILLDIFLVLFSFLNLAPESLHVKKHLKQEEEKLRGSK